MTEGKNISLTKMWGASAQIRFGAGLAIGQSIQLADIRFPEPAVAGIYFYAAITAGVGTIVTTSLELTIGLGRTTAQRTLSYSMQPTVAVALDVIIPDQPMHNLLAQVVAQGNSSAGPGTEIILTCSLQAAPVTKLNMEAEPLKFGMALPGEADGLDDAMLEDLEDQHPGAAEILRARDGDDGDDGDDDDEEQPNAHRELVRMLAADLTKRLGRKPTRRELAFTVRRFVQLTQGKAQKRRRFERRSRA